MPLRDSAKDAMLTDESVRLTHVSLHTGFPAVSNELSGGPYARQQIVWKPPAAGVLAKTTAHPVFQVQGGTTVTAIGIGAATGEPRADSPIASTVFNADGTFTLTACSVDLNV